MSDRPKCWRKGCEACARYYPVVLLYADRRRWPDAPPARMVCGIPLCATHRDDITLDELLPDESWARIVIAFAQGKKASPVRHDCRLEFVPWDADEVLAYERSRQ